MINVCEKEVNIMTKKDYQLYGTNVLNLKTQEIGLLICTWKNKFADAEIDCLGFLPRSQSFAFMPLRHSQLNLLAIRSLPYRNPLCDLC